MVMLLPKDRVLDIPCGFGRHSDLLNSYGLQVVGVDLSTMQVRAAAARSTAEFLQADMIRLPLASGSFRLVINLWTSFGYEESEDADQQVLAEMYRVTANGGTLVMELSTLENALYSVSALGDAVNIKRVEYPGGIIEDAFFDWSTRIAKVTYTRGAWARTFCTRMYSRRELENLCLEVGFRNVTSFAGFSSNKATDDQRCVLLATKRA
jgi:ubiquinone/menaquinone biosynthesis C-methylase UbiE